MSGPLRARAFECCALIAAGLVLVASPLAAQNFTFSIDPVTIPYDPATGEGSTTAFIRLGQNIEPGVAVVEVQGFSVSYSHDTALLRTTTIDFAGVQLGLNGGNGPGLGSTFSYDGGATSGSVFSLSGSETISFFSPEIVLAVTLETNPTAWIGNTTGGTATFSSQNPVGAMPPVDDMTVVDAMSVPTSWSFPVIQFVPITDLFLRGDANGDGQLIAVADAITILGGLFGGETIACAAAADVNADGSLNIADAITVLNYGFQGGPPPPPPFPACGTETISTTLTCDQGGC